jgi:hypothetical protein
MPPAPSEPLRRLPVKARIIVSPAGMPRWPTLTVTERCRCPFTPDMTDTLGCGAGRGRGSDPIGGQPGRTGTASTRAPIACRATLHGHCPPRPRHPDHRGRVLPPLVILYPIHSPHARRSSRDFVYGPPGKA